jgi:hypothetical protein
LHLALFNIMPDTRIGHIVDQLGHAVWAFAVVYVAMRWSGAWWAGAAAGALIALPRELVDQWPIDNWFDTAVDSFYFMIAGLIAALVI